MPITLVLVDDHPFLLDGVEQLLSLDDDFRVLSKCASVDDAVRAIDLHAPDIVILDLKLKDEDGFAVLRHLSGRPRPSAIVLTATDSEEDLLQAVRLGARGVVLKAMAPRSLEECIRVVHAGGEWLTVEGQNLGERLARREAVERSLAERLTAREIEILRLLASNYDNDEIARRLRLSIGTVKIHVHHVYQKLGVNGRQGLQQYLSTVGY
jgi:DNA-binding NarL/FixJ family response regulator